MAIALLLTASSEAFVHTLPLRTSLGAGASLRHRMAIDPETMAAVSVYDSGMEAKVASLTAELESVKAELKTKSDGCNRYLHARLLCCVQNNPTAHNTLCSCNRS